MIALEDCAILILASGQSRRFGDQNKLLAQLNGKALAEHVATMASSIPVKSIFAVTPAGDERVLELFSEHNIKVLENPAPETGQGASLALGAQALALDDFGGLFVLLADMPLVIPDDLASLANALPEGGAAIAHGGQHRTPPVLFHRDLFPDLCALSGDKGAASVLIRCKSVAEVSINPERLIDIDSPEALAQVEKPMS